MANTLTATIKEYADTLKQQQTLSDTLTALFDGLINESKTTLETKYFSGRSERLEISKEDYEKQKEQEKQFGVSNAPSTVHAVPIRTLKDFEIVKSEFRRVFANTVKETSVFKNKEGLEITQIATHYFDSEDFKQGLISNDCFFVTPFFTMIDSSHYSLTSNGFMPKETKRRPSPEEMYKLMFSDNFDITKITIDLSNCYNYFGNNEIINKMKDMGVIPENPKDIIDITTIDITSIPEKYNEPLKLGHKIKDVNGKKYAVCTSLSGLDDTTIFANCKDKRIAQQKVKTCNVNISVTLYVKELDQWVDAKLQTSVRICLTPYDFEKEFRNLTALYGPQNQKGANKIDS